MGIYLFAYVGSGSALDYRYFKGTTSGISKVELRLFLLPYRDFDLFFVRGPLGTPSSSRSDIIQCFSKLSTSRASRNSSKT